MTDDNSLAGVCLIKEKYVVKDHVRSLSAQHVSKHDLEKIDSSDLPAEDEPTIKKLKVDTPQIKLKGQNKKRGGRTKDPSQELCLALIKGTSKSCSRANCRFNHDLVSYLASKPPDIGPECHLYRLYGACPWGVTCRFGSEHLTEEGTNVIGETATSITSIQQSSKHPLDKETVTKLWKKRYDFTKSNRCMEIVEKKFEFETLKREEDENKSKDEKNSCSLENNTSKEKPSDSLERISGNHQIESKDDANHEGLSESEKGGDDVKMEIADDVNPETDDGKRKVDCLEKTLGAIDDSDTIKIRSCEKKKIEWRGLLYLSPLTTVGNLPFRRICREFGADITCSEMTLALSLLQGTREWTLTRRHPSETLYGIQVCGSNPSVMTKCAQLLEENTSVDFIDINLGCPLDVLYQQGCGSGLMCRKGVLKRTVEGMSSVLTQCHLTVKLRTGVLSSTPLAHSLLPLFRTAGVSLATVHGRSREQRYTRSADWSYISECAQAASPMPIFGNGDVLSFEDYFNFLDVAPGCAGAMIGRGGLIKPWLFTEIKEKRHWDISSSERFDIVKKYVNYGLEHWGSDSRGVETTRRFLLEWLSFLHRYVPYGLLERPPQKINQRPPVYEGRDHLETLMTSANCSDWIKISEMLLGRVPDSFVFLPKHKSNAWK